MPGIRTLQEIYKDKSEDFLVKLLNSFVIVNQQNQGSFFSFHKEDGEVIFSKKGGIITHIDRILMKYYESAILQVNQIPADVMSQIDDGYQFCFDYIPDEPAKMSLTYIVNMQTNKHVHTNVELQKWAKLFNVNGPNILFEGFLSDEQKKDILDFVYADEEKLISKYKKYSFTAFLCNLFGIDEANENLKSIVFRFYYAGKETGAYIGKMIDPLFKHRTKDNEKIHDIGVNDYVYLIIIDLMNFIEKYTIRDLKRMVKLGPNQYDNYILLMNAIFKEFIAEFGEKYFNIKIEPPKFMQNDIFDINSDMLDDNAVKVLLDIHPNYKEIYKILLNFFRKKRKKPNGIFDKNLLMYFNDLVNKLNKYVLSTDVMETSIPSFNEYISPLSENFTIYNPLSDKNSFKAYRKTLPITVLVDEFQPFSNKHVNNMLAMHKKYRNKIVLFPIYNESTSMFSGQLMQNMMSKLMNEFSKVIHGYYLVENESMDGIVDKLYPEYKLKHLSSSAPRIRDYVLYLDFLKNKKKELNIDRDFTMVSLDYDNTEIINALLEDNYQLFSENVPSCLHMFFPEMRHSMSQRQET